MGKKYRKFSKETSDATTPALLTNVLDFFTRFVKQISNEKAMPIAPLVEDD